MELESVTYRHSQTYIRIPRTVIESKVSPASKIVYGAMMGLQGKHGHMFASHGRIGAVAGVSRNTVRHAIQELLNAGLIVLVTDKGEPLKMKGGFKGVGSTFTYACRYLIGRGKKVVIINEASA